jgi:hypothetical protein
MKEKIRVLFAALLLMLPLAFGFAGGGQQGAAPSGGGSAASGGSAVSGVNQINGGRPVTLRLEFHSTWTPTLNTVPTAETPTVVQSTQRIADKFMRLHPNVTIEWVRTKPSNNAISAAEWFTTQISAGTAPAVAYTWNNAYLDRGWYFDLTPAMDTPNEYLPGNKRWKDQYPEYIWSRNMSDTANRIIAVPVTLSAGPATAYYYNKDIFAKLNLGVPTNWEEMRTVVKALKAGGYGALVPWDGNPGINTDLWPLYFSISPGYGLVLMDQVDYDHSGVFDTSEQVRATKANVFNPVTQEYAREVFFLLKEMFNDMYVPGYESVDIPGLWDSGTLGMKQNGVWGFATEASNTKRKFDYDVFPVPVVTTATSKNVRNIEFTKAGPYQPGGDSFNLIKPTVEKDKGVEAAAIAFLKFFTVPENLNEYILENGTLIGAVRDTVIPPMLEGWLSRPFPIIPNFTWPTAFTSDAHLSMGKELEMWVKGQTTDSVFFQRWNQLQQKSADDVIVANGINTSGW